MNLPRTAKIVALGRTIDPDNWADWNVGPPILGTIWASECCECDDYDFRVFNRMPIGRMR